MRVVYDILTVLMFFTIVGGMLLMNRQQRLTEQDYAAVRQSLARLAERTVYHKALGDAELTEAGHPKQIDPSWFGGAPPVNVLSPEGSPWIDVAPPGDFAEHPPDPLLIEPGQAGIWYNPNNGVFRARAPALVTDRASLELYNRLNSVSLAELPFDGRRERQPIAHAPLPYRTAQSRGVDPPRTTTRVPSDREDGVPGDRGSTRTWPERASTSGAWSGDGAADEGPTVDETDRSRDEATPRVDPEPEPEPEPQTILGRPPKKKRGGS